MVHRNNLLPVDGKPVQVVNIVEAFLRYDDKPIITHTSGIKESLIKYCYNRHFAIASKSYGGWSKMYFGETVPMFDEKDEIFWIVTPGDYEGWKAEQRKGDEGVKKKELGEAAGRGGETRVSRGVDTVDPEVSAIREFSKVMVRGKANAVLFN